MIKNSSRYWLDQELQGFADAIPRNSLVLDAGAGDQVYAKFFSSHRYESADFQRVDKFYRDPTYTCDLTEIPVEDSRFDAVVFTQVMEHLPEPLSVLRELNRILKPGGKLFYTGPLWYEEHEIPYDFYRYTRYGLRHLFDKSGFQITEFRPLDGYLGTVAHQLRLMKKHLPRKLSDYGGGFHGFVTATAFLLLRSFLPFLSKAATLADYKYRYENGLVINYLAVLEKPA